MTAKAAGHDHRRDGFGATLDLTPYGLGVHQPMRAHALLAASAEDCHPCTAAAIDDLAAHGTDAEMVALGWTLYAGLAATGRL